MRKSEINFPHPLLNGYNHDYIDGCQFEISIDTITEEDNNFIVPVFYDLKCDGLKELVDSGAAKILLRISCSYTSYRDIVLIDTEQTDITISKNKVSRRIEISPYIVASADINDFKLKEHDLLYFGNTVFKVNEGELLAEGSLIQINLDDSELEKQLSSVIKIDSVSGIDYLNVVYDNADDGLIHIQMPEDEYKSYFNLRERYGRYGVSRFLQSAIILPALVEGIALLREEKALVELDPEYEEKYSDTTWAESAFARCEELKRDIYDANMSSFGLANEILGAVTKDSLSDLHNKAKEMYNNSGATRLGGVD